MFVSIPVVLVFSPNGNRVDWAGRVAHWRFRCCPVVLGSQELEDHLVGRRRYIGGGGRRR